MKKITTLLLTLFLLMLNNLSIKAQITKQEAISILMDSIVGNKSDSVNVFLSSQVVSGDYFNINFYDSINVPYNNYWTGFIDEQPLYLWNHLCTYVFIDETNGNYYIDTQTSPPFGSSTQFDTLSIAIEFSVPQLDYSMHSDSISININVNKHLYAVLFSGFGQNTEPAFWNHLSHMYCSLKEKGFAEENIYALAGNGKVDYTSWGNASLDLDNDSDDDILNIPCSINSLDSIFQVLGSKIKEDDLLYIFVSTHGSWIVGDTENSSFLLLYNNEPLWDSTFAQMLTNINCSHIIIPIYACHAGRFVDDLSSQEHKEKRTIITPVPWNKAYARNLLFINKYGMDVFPYFLITTLRGWHPEPNAPWSKGYEIGECPGDSLFPFFDSTDFNPDYIINQGNGDSIIQIGETIYYTKEHDLSFKNFGVINYDCGFLKEDLLSLTGISGEIDTTQTLQGNYLIGGELSINSGVNLTLDTSTNFFVTGTKIIVKQGAVLSVDGATVTSVHDSVWQGIEVWGNTNAHQYTINGNCAQGKLYLKNNAAIKNAYNAVTLWKPDSWSNRGGIIIAKDSKFINNKRSVEFMAYQNHHPVSGEETDYVSSFTNCDFIYDDNYLLSEGMKNHVTMWGVRGIEFRGCSFINEVSSEPNTGYGIFSLDAGYRIKDYCNAQIMPCPESGIIRSTFKGLKFGIQSANVNKPLYNISIFNSVFTNNGYGVHLSATYGSAIVNNNFKLGAIYDTCNNLFGTGIHLDNSKAFAVENNTFTLYDNSVEAEYLGIRTVNTNNAQDEIYKNSFNGLKTGNLAEGKNWSIRKEHGLAYYCNNNQNNQNDFDVEKIGSSRYNNIQLLQGNKDYPAGNTFSANTHWHFYNNGDDTITYVFQQGILSQKPLLRYHVKLDSLQQANGCPSHCTGGDIRLSSTQYQQRENDYNSAVSSYNSSSSSYDAATNQSTRNYWSDKMSYYNMQRARAAYDIIRSDMADTIAHPDRFKTWMEKLDTYTTAEAMVDYYMQQGDYTTALNKVDSLPYSFTFTAYDSIEYPMYKDFKHMQADWLSDGRTIFSLNTSEVNSLIAIADSSKGTAGAQARAILRFAYPSQYSYIDCITSPGSNNKSAKTGDKTSIDANSSNIVVIAKPNPANNTVTFSYTLPVKVETATLVLYGTAGKPLYKQVLSKQASSLQYNCSHLKAGVYYYSVSAAGKTTSGKLVIVR